MQPDDKLCYCFHVSQRKVMNFIRIHRPRVPSEISECGGAGTGCGWCVPFLKRLFESHRTKQGGMIEMDSSEYELGRATYVRETGKKLPSGATPVGAPGNTDGNDETSS
ncbi:MAG: bacterioferritin-associated ferredoxin [Planctomyces sp.]